MPTITTAASTHKKPGRMGAASCSARDCAYYGSPDANTRCVVISAPTTGGGQ